jgi:predicted metal-dependent phosphoesterase TrpH
MRCDLHVHTAHSGMCTVPGLSLFCRESYNEPRALYETLKRRGMDLVTVTDHDSIDAAEELRSYPDFFLSEEVTCVLPSGAEMHAGVYGISERDHIELQRRRKDVPSLLAYAIEQHLFVSANHIYSSLTGLRRGEDFATFARDFHGIEAVNGHMLLCANRFAASFAERFSKPAIGGSDAHTLHCAGKTYTDVPHARTTEEFLLGLRRGRCLPHGESGDYWKLTGAVLSIGAALIRQNRRWWPYAPLLSVLFGLAPIVTAGNYVRELAFAWYWGTVNRPVEPNAAMREIV